MRNRLSYKLMAAVGLAAALVTSIAGYLVFQSYSRIALADAGGYAEQISETIKSSTQHEMLLNRRATGRGFPRLPP